MFIYVTLIKINTYLLMNPAMLPSSLVIKLSMTIRMNSIIGSCAGNTNTISVSNSAFTGNLPARSHSCLERQVLAFCVMYLSSCKIYLGESLNE